MTKSGIAIRPATPDDLQTLRRFEQGIVQAERPFDDTLQPGAIHYYDIAKLIADARVRFLVADCAGQPVGCGFARLEAAKLYVRHAVQAYLGLMYVEPAFRGQSINGQIVAALAQWCRAQGVTELRLDVYSENQAALQAYQKAGFAPRMTEMRLKFQ